METRGQTLEETAAVFDGENKPEPVTAASREASVIVIRRMSTSGFEQDDDDGGGDGDDFLYPGKVGGFQSYKLRRPQLVLERDRVSHTKGNIVLSFDKGI